MHTKGEEKILYYLGAGASAGPSISDNRQALPIAKSIDRSNWSGEITGLPHALRTLANQLERYPPEGNIYPQPFFSNVLNDFHELANKGEELGNVDMYAKYLKIKGETILLDKLKRTLSIYFAIEQNWNGKLDKRYRNWFISIMDFAKFPENIKILSWNYDFQIQIAVREYREESVSYSKGGAVKKSPPLIEYYPEIGPGYFNNNDFSLIHLNGIAGLFVNSDSRYHVYSASYAEDKQKMIEAFQDNSNLDDFHFAWEGGNYHERLLKSVEKMIGGTTIMVVIGYSFPFFNRDVDKVVFEFLKKEGGLKKIYYQDPVLDGEQLKAQFGFNKDFDIVHVPAVENFHIPFEY